MILRIFMDASVFFAALYSPQGAARELLRLGLTGKVRLVISENVLDEVARNILKKAPHVEPLYRLLLAILDLEIVEAPQQELVIQVTAYVAPKDAHVVAAAIEARPDYLVTYDRRHLVDRPEVAQRSGLKIVTPDVVVRRAEELNRQRGTD